MKSEGDAERFVDIFQLAGAQASQASLQVLHESLDTMTVGLVLRISVPNAGSSATP